ncbi:hypothetical protein M431DRAFT_483510 [Trichoderma harzianum CBS 226.95]|uniref:Uncharacterized protein n=1 Tax=Trichoderma harzianum CBS 226.95 TaxID=983964 RepID=A0A2T4A8F7_TRIHA|nr:hypothetical protein M431DRAFT_483510 [Trichoderma harzianum CBS 226.95]PTB53359.1 hypothetical protein M431DRAFT_483510 [Trichoderma harzianum CBS 226.95]
MASSGKAFRKAAQLLDQRAPQGGIDQSSTARLQDLREANRQTANTVIHTSYAMDEMGRQRACALGRPSTYQSLWRTSRAMLQIPRLTTIAFNRHIRQQKGKRWAELGQARRFPAKRRLDKQRVYFLHLASKPGVVAPESEMKSPSMTLSAGMKEEGRGGLPSLAASKISLAA